eukprot:TRINITY_DN16201_c0_g1_i1.p1 TRINITY_DN16201_c0_g1~~TRINITY_DN16201_c0_g1_i1.p1  ORF type:complete len:161 (+),score=61.96 TRINITY_DN16201_c0_g1_i1:141-623(+)
MTPEQRARMMVTLSPDKKEALIDAMTPQEKAEQAAYNRGTFDQQLAGLQERKGSPSTVLNPSELHMSILHEGLTLAPDKEAMVILALQQQPAKTIIVMCGLPISAAHTLRVVRGLVIPNLKISTQLKMEINREIVVNPAAADVQQIRDRLVAAVTSAVLV